MLELLLGWLDALAGWWLVSASARRLAQWIRRRKGGAVTGGGVEFFPERDTLKKLQRFLGCGWLGTGKTTELHDLQEAIRRNSLQIPTHF
jgi:hypothetical protein